MTVVAKTLPARASPALASELSRAEVLTWLKAQPALRPQPKPAAKRFGTGLAALDELAGGGLPCGAITELVGRGSSGRTSLTLAILAGATQQGEVVAWVDPQDALDPVSAQAAGIILERLLWIRPQGKDAMRLGLNAADLVLDAGGFAVLALDLAGSHWRSILGRPSSWLRLKHRLEHSRTVLLVLAPHEATGTSAALRLECRRLGQDKTMAIRVARKLHGSPGAEARLTLGEAVD